MINQLEKKYVNHQSINCKDVKIGMLEYSASTLFPSINVNNVLNFTCEDILEDGHVVDDNHPYKVACILRDMTGLNCTINFYPQNNEGIKRAIADGCHIISFSGGNVAADDTLEQQLAKNTLLVCGVGNDGSLGEGITARNSWWNAVGAYHYSSSGAVEFANYSSYKYGRIKTCGFSAIQYKENSNYILGTSYATPFVVGLLAQYMQAYYTRLGFMPSIAELNDFIVENSKPIINEPLKEGYGLLVLPNLSTYNFGTVLGEKYGNRINVNGAWTNTINPPMMVNNKLMVELTVLRNCKGNRVYWNDKEKLAIIR